MFALFCSLRSRRRTIERAELGLAARRQAGWFHPKLVAGAIQASRGGGWRRLLPLLALGILGASLGIERSKREGERAEWPAPARACRLTIFTLGGRSIGPVWRLRAERNPHQLWPLKLQISGGL
jgi:hypothetical protein